MTTEQNPLAWVTAAMDALASYEADYGERLPDDHDLGRIDESRGSPSFRIRVGHIRQLAALTHAREAGAQEPVAVPAKELYPAHPGALRACMAELDMWLDSSDALDEIKNQQSFGESIMLVVHELKRLQSVLAASPVAPTADGEEEMRPVTASEHAGLCGALQRASVPRDDLLAHTPAQPGEG